MFLENSDVDVKTHFYFWNGQVLWKKKLKLKVNLNAKTLFKINS